MDGQAIGTQAIAEAALRRLASEHGGARPGGVRGEASSRAAGERTARATRP
jgi:hypothetical protein